MTRRTIPISFKKEVIEYIEAEKCTPNHAWKHFNRIYSINYDVSQYYQWWKQKKIKNMNNDNRVRVTGAGRPILLGTLEECLYEKIIELRIYKVKVTRSWIREQALLIANENGITTFLASNTWCDSFMERYRLSLRRITNLTLLSDEQLIQRTIEFMLYLNKMKLEINLEKTVLMDETSVYFEDTRAHTVDIKGRKHVIIKSTGFSSMRITACIAIFANGNKCPPLVIHKAKDSNIIKRLPGPLLVTHQKSAWVNSDLLIKWIDSIFPLTDFSTGKCIVWDSCRAHISKAIKEHCQKRKIKMIVIPGGCTPYLQAGDIGIFKELKDILSKKINSWKNSDLVEYTKNGNPKQPKEEVVNKWLVESWRDVKNSNINNSIKSAGFSDDYSDWHISKHDVYGERFRIAWEENFNAENVNIIEDFDEDFQDDDIIVDESSQYDNN